MSWLEWDIRDAKEYAAKEGRAEGRAEGMAKGAEDERKRQADLVAAMTKAGCSTDEIVSCLVSGNIEALYAKYGVTAK